MPPVEILKEAVGGLKKLKDSGIECYIIAGSHDFSVSGKTFLDVIEKAGLCKNIAKFSERDMGNGESMTMLEFFTDGNLLFAGLPGKKGGLETRMFKNLQFDDLRRHNDKVKIFVLHTTLTEAKPKELFFIESIDVSELPDGFDYYAAGHLHLTSEFRHKGKPVVYPGPLFPNNFEEMEELKNGSFCIVEIKDGKENVERCKIKLRDVVSVHVDVTGNKPEQATQTILKKILENDIKDKIIALKVSGNVEGKTSDINFDEIIAATSECYAMLRNTSELANAELKIEVQTKSNNIEDIEKEIIGKYVKEEKEWDFIPYINTLLQLDMEKQEGETVAAFESRVNEEAVRILGLKDKIR
jgi:DNA repair exonuclease SbcCD nuclease subunit